MEPMEELHEKHLPVDDDIRFHLRQRFVQHLGWFILLSFLVAALVGFVGPGLFSSKTVMGKNCWVRYEPTLHQQTSDEVEIHVEPQADSAKITVEVSQSYLEKIGIEQILPEPAGSLLTSKGISWTFDTQITEPAGTLRLKIKPERPGNASMNLRVGNETLHFQQLILP